MKTARLLRAVSAMTFIGLCAASSIVGCATTRGRPRFKIQSERLVGNELRAILVTATGDPPSLSGGAKVLNAKGWLIIVDLSKTGPIGERARVIGPLWDDPDERSELSFDVGRIDEKGIAVAQARPFIAFEPDGTVVRIRTDPKGGGGMIREHMVIEPKPCWKPDGAYVPIPRPDYPSEIHFDTSSGHYRFQITEGKAALYERLTGKRISDPWLETAGTELHRIKDFKTLDTWLTADLKYLVSYPVSTWNELGVIHDTFHFGGKEYPRAEYALLWQRPRPEPVVIKKLFKEHASIWYVTRAISLDGRLYFYVEPLSTIENVNAPNDAVRAEQKAVVKLVPFADGAAFQVRLPHESLEYRMWSEMQQLDKPHRLALFTTSFFWGGDPPQGRDDEDEIRMLVWDLQKGTISDSKFRTGELFTTHLEEYVPLQSVEVLKP
jgi:hypothetical protein